MWAAGALRGSPASTTITDRRWRPSWSAAASPAADPPTTATSQCRSTVRGAWSLMASTIGSHPICARALARFARTSEDAMAELDEIEQVVRTRLRSLRTTLGLSLDELAARTNLSPSTISRVETGKRTISLDILLPLASALQVDLDALLDVRSDDDVVIRPAPSTSGNAHDLDAEPTDRQHRSPSRCGSNRRAGRRSSGSTPVTTGSSSSRGGCACRSANARSSSRPARPPSSPP